MMEILRLKKVDYSMRHRVFQILKRGKYYKKEENFWEDNYSKIIIKNKYE